MGYSVGFAAGWSLWKRATSSRSVLNGLICKISLRGYSKCSYPITWSHVCRGGGGMILYKANSGGHQLRYPIRRGLSGSDESEEVVKVSVEESPNEHHLKFVLNVPVIGQSMKTVEFLNGEEARKHSPLADMLFKIDETCSVLLGSHFITVGKTIDVSWDEIRDKYVGAIEQFFKEGKNVLNEVQMDHEKPHEDDDETVAMIKEIIETRIRPAVQEDGGDIEFVGFEDGVVRVSLKGSCRTCDLSVFTLRDGVERMLKYYVNGVTSVVQDITEIE